MTARLDRATVTAATVMPAAQRNDAPAHHLGEPVAGPRFQRIIERVHALGPRPLAEMIAEIAAVTGQHVLVVDLVEEYAQLDRAVLRFLGADRFPPRVLGVVR